MELKRGYRLACYNSTCECLFTSGQTSLGKTLLQFNEFKQRVDDYTKEKGYGAEFGYITLETIEFINDGDFGSIVGDVICKWEIEETGTHLLLKPMGMEEENT